MGMFHNDKKINVYENIIINVYASSKARTDRTKGCDWRLRVEEDLYFYLNFILFLWFKI